VTILKINNKKEKMNSKKKEKAVKLNYKKDEFLNKNPYGKI